MPCHGHSPSSSFSPFSSTSCVLLAVAALLGFVHQWHTAEAFLTPRVGMPVAVRRAGASAGPAGGGANHFLDGFRPLAATTVPDHHSQAAASPAASTATEEDKLAQVVGQLRQVMDPDLGSDVVTLGFIKNLTIQAAGTVSFVLELTTPACPVKDDLKAQATRVVEALPWVAAAEVTLSARPINANAQASADLKSTGLSLVNNVIAVSSCKGGVGKSTTAVNLAFALDRQGAKVGILDADIYGPSLPTMVAPDTEVVEFVESQIRPMMKITGVDGAGQPKGVKLMSFGYVNPGAAAIMRGPMVIQLINQLLTLTSWGELDYLIIDMPPGTGDIPLTLCQSLNITAAVIVTTPQRLSFTDVVKGVDMFDTVNVPCVAVVENMAYADVSALDDAAAAAAAPGGKGDASAAASEPWQNLRQDLEQVVAAGKKGDSAALVDEVLATVQKRLQADRVAKPLFGRGHRQRLAEMWGLTNTVSLPVLEDVSKSGDSGVPLVLGKPDSAPAQVFLDLAGRVVREVAKLRHDRSRLRPSVTYLPAEHMIAVTVHSGGGSGDGGGEASLPTEAAAAVADDVQPRQKISPAALRRQCRCAMCVEEMTGRQILRPEDVSEDIKPVDIGSVGNYAVGITWTDGHKSLFPYRSFVEGYENNNGNMESRKR